MHWLYLLVPLCIGLVYLQRTGEIRRRRGRFRNPAILSKTEKEERGRESGSFPKQ